MSSEFLYQPQYRIITGNTNAALLLSYLIEQHKSEAFIANPAKELKWTSREFKNALSIIGTEQTEWEDKNRVGYDIKGTYLYCQDFVSYWKENKETYFHIHLDLVMGIYMDSHTGQWRRNIRSTGDGIVYLIETELGYKIGQTKKAAQRTNSVLRSIPGKGRVIHTIETPDRIGLEKRLHIKYSHKKIKGEWFKLTPEDIQYIKSIPCPCNK